MLSLQSPLCVNVSDGPKNNDKIGTEFLDPIRFGPNTDHVFCPNDHAFGPTRAGQPTIVNQIWDQNCKPIILHFWLGPKLLTLGIERRETVIGTGSNAFGPMIWRDQRRWDQHSKTLGSPLYEREPIRRLDTQGSIRTQGFLKLKQLIRLCNKVYRLIRLCQCPIRYVMVSLWKHGSRSWFTFFVSSTAHTSILSCKRILVAQDAVVGTSSRVALTVVIMRC